MSSPLHIIDFDGTRTDEPGFYRMSAEQYHADPCATPSLSSSIAKVLLGKTPRHAFVTHPRLAPQEKRDEPNAGMRLGTAIHKLAIGAGGRLHVIDAPDFKTKAAQEARAHAYAIHRTPVLVKEFDEADKIAEKVMEGVQRVSGAADMLRGGEPELVAIWREANGAMCRAMFDHFRLDGDKALIDDLKTSGDDIGPGDIGRKIANMSYDVSAAFYERGVKALIPDAKPLFRFLFVETDTPYEVLVTTLDGAASAIGHRKVRAAIHVWRNCQLADKWPGFPRSIVRAELPAWNMTSWELRETDDPLLDGVNYGA